MVVIHIEECYVNVIKCTTTNFPPGDVKYTALKKRKGGLCSGSTFKQGQSVG